MADVVIPLQNGQTLTTGASETVYVQISQGQTLTVAATDIANMGGLFYAVGGPIAVESGVEEWKAWPGANPPAVSPAALPWVAPGSVVVQVNAAGEALTLGARASTGDDLHINWANPTYVELNVSNLAITLTDEQCKASMLYLTDLGSHAGRTDLIFPQRVGLYCIDNSTYGSGTGGGNISLITANAGNTPLQVDAGTKGWYWCNGVDLFGIDNPPGAFTDATVSGTLSVGGNLTNGTTLFTEVNWPRVTLCNGMAVFDGDNITTTINSSLTCSGGLQAGNGNFVVDTDGNLTSTNLVGTLYISDGVDVVLASGIGSSIATAPTQKLGFYGVSPVTQPAAPTTLADVIAALKALGLVAT